MHILFIPSFYPEKSAPFNGTFFKNQTKMLLSKVEKIGTVYTEQKSLKSLFSGLHQNRYQRSITKEQGILTYRRHALNLRNQYEIGARIWILLTSKLVDDYISDNGKPDIIHAHNVFHAGRVAEKVGFKYKIPYIITEHASGFLLKEYTARQLQVAKEIYENAATTLAVSSSLAKSVAKECRIDLPITVPNVVDTNTFHFNPAKKKNDTFVFISVGNLLKNKGHHILIEAFHLFKEKTKMDVELHIYGSGIELENLQKQIINLNLTKYVFMKGKVTSKELANTYQQMHCLVLPSFKETFGVVIIEAMGCGLPVIATKSGGPEDLVDQSNGLIIESGNAMDMALALEKMVVTYQKYNPLEISNNIKYKFSETVVANQLLKIYKKVLA